MHVLSTPPAFILSQDQTLMLKSFNPARRSGFSNQKQIPIYCFKVCFFKSCSFIFRWLEFILDELCSSWIFQGYSLFSYQCSLLFSATLICYHIFKCLSTTFFIFLFQFFRTDVLSFCDSFDILSNPFRFVKNFFHFLFRSDSVLCDSLIILSNRQPFVNNFFQKNSNNIYCKFERRKRDLNPRAGWPDLYP